MDKSCRLNKSKQVVEDKVFTKAQPKKIYRTKINPYVADAVQPNTSNSSAVPNILPKHHPSSNVANLSSEDPTSIDENTITATILPSKNSLTLEAPSSEDQIQIVAAASNDLVTDIIEKIPNPAPSESNHILSEGLNLVVDLSQHKQSESASTIEKDLIVIQNQMVEVENTEAKNIEGDTSKDTEEIFEDGFTEIPTKSQQRQNRRKLALKASPILTRGRGKLTFQ